MNSMDVLAKVEIFGGLKPKQLEEIGQIATIKKYAEGEEIFHESAVAEHLHILLNGEVVLQVQLSSHNTKITVGLINRSNQCFGWSGVIAPHYYTATAVCQQESEVMEVQGQKLLDILKEDPAGGFQVLMHITQIISTRLRNCRMALLKTL